MGNLQPLACQKHQEDEHITIRPFMAHHKRPCVTVLLSPQSSLARTAASAAPATLLKLILAQDWQRVLCRMALYPAELSCYMPFAVTATHSLLVLPLHLACTLNPPSTVISVMLELFVDAVAMPIRPIIVRASYSRKKNSRRSGTRGDATQCPHDIHRWKQWKSRFGDWRSHRKGAFPTTDFRPDGEKIADAPETPALVDKPSVFLDAVQDHESTSGAIEKASSSSISSRTSTVGKDMDLQRLPSTDDEPLMSLALQATDDTYSSQTSVGVIYTANSFRMHWSLEPLLKHVLQEGSLLPLHICCLYSSCKEVIQAVARAYPAGALREIVGMMPIHWVAAGWTLQPLIPQPTAICPVLTTGVQAIQEVNTPASFLQTLDVLEILRQTVPSSVQVRSGNHGMTPEDYIYECMEDSEYKELCLNVVRADTAFFSSSGADGCNVTFSSRDDKVFDTSSSDSDSDHTDQSAVRTKSLMSLLDTRDWESMLAAIETCPSLAARWMYGIDATECTVWKRLPLHLVCEHSDVPIGLVSILLQFYPDAAYAVDRLDGSSPLHIACRSHVSLRVLKLLLTKGSDATGTADHDGRVPLHWAVWCGASYEAIEALATENPRSVLSLDANDATPIDLARDVYGEHHTVHELLSAICHTLIDHSL